MKYNLKSIIVGLIVTLLGGALIVADIFWWKTDSMVWISIGCSLIASALVILLNVFLVDASKYNPLDDWGLKRIAYTRADINNDCGAELRKAKYQVDIVAFGLQSFRNKQSNEVENYLKKGVNFRILTMNPSSEYIKAREKEEDDTNIKNSVEKLIDWANQLNNKNYKGKIIVKGYSCMTLDFYWRIDDIVYVGPYWYGYDSQQTITYKFTEGGSGYQLYTDYFEKIWNEKDLTQVLTTITKFKKK